MFSITLKIVTSVQMQEGLMKSEDTVSMGN